MLLFITKFFKTTPDSLVKELDSANNVFNKAIERLKKIKLKATTRMVKNNNRINRYKSENDKLEYFNSRVDSQIGKYRDFVE